MGCANLCSDKWFSTDFGNKKVAKSLQCTLERCGLKIAKIGNTFQSDHLKSNGAICESAIDHVYYSADFEHRLVTGTLKNSSSDHLPVICVVQSLPKALPYSRDVTKRCLKGFNEEKWNDSLINKDWSGLEECTSVDEMVDILSKNIEEALDEVAPIITCILKPVMSRFH